MPIYTLELLNKVLVCLLLFAIVDSAVLCLSDRVLDAEEVELVETEKGESEKGDKESDKEKDEKDPKISPSNIVVTFHIENNISPFLDKIVFHLHHSEVCSPPPERGLSIVLS